MALSFLSSIFSRDEESSSSSPKKGVDVASLNALVPDRIKEVELKVVVLGGPGVGKSSIIRRFTQGIFTTQHVPTLGIDLVSAAVTQTKYPSMPSTVRLFFYDVAHQEVTGKHHASILAQAAGIVVVFDATELDQRKQSLRAVDQWHYVLGQYANTRSVPMILLANKTDIGKVSMKPDALDEYAASCGYGGWYNTSAKSGNQIRESILALVARMLKRENERLEGIHAQESEAKERRERRERKYRENNNKPRNAVTAEAKELPDKTKQDDKQPKEVFVEKIKPAKPDIENEPAVQNRKLDETWEGDNMENKILEVHVLIEEFYKQLLADLTKLAEGLAKEREANVQELKKQAENEHNQLKHRLLTLHWTKQDDKPNVEARKLHISAAENIKKWQRLMHNLETELSLAHSVTALINRNASLDFGSLTTSELHTPSSSSLSPASLCSPFASPHTSVAEPLSHPFPFFPNTLPASSPFPATSEPMELPSALSSVSLVQFTSAFLGSSGLSSERSSPSTTPLHAAASPVHNTDGIGGTVPSENMYISPVRPLSSQGPKRRKRVGFGFKYAAKGPSNNDLASPATAIATPSTAPLMTPLPQSNKAWTPSSRTREAGSPEQSSPRSYSSPYTSPPLSARRTTDTGSRECSPPATPFDSTDSLEHFHLQVPSREDNPTPPPAPRRTTPHDPSPASSP